MFAEVQSLGDFSVGVSFRQAVNYLQFSRGEVAQAHKSKRIHCRSSGQRLQNKSEFFSRGPDLPLMNTGNAFHQSFDWAVLGEHSPCAEPESLDHNFALRRL